MAGIMRKEWLALGLILIVAGLALLSFSRTVVSNDNYIVKASVDNLANINEGRPMELSVAANFSTGQRFFFNFTHGRFWGLSYDQQHGLEPANTNFAPGWTILPFKTLEVDVSTPSGDVVDCEVYLVGAIKPLAVSYLNVSTDFTPLSEGNLTFSNTAAVQGLVEHSGLYTVTVTDIEPYVQRSAGLQYNISSDPTIGDPPSNMSLYNVETVETRPFFSAFVATGAVLLTCGVSISVWSARSKGRRHLTKYSKTSSGRPRKD